ncbi:MAG: hypothetical protein KDJ65_09900 [Anaerolineae bacterium]|nr:hypothetical protein [Anaerolineae bacterium]
MSKNGWEFKRDDDKERSYGFILSLFVLFLAPSLTPAILVLVAIIFFQLRIPNESFLSLALCSCAVYPVMVIISVAAAWYFYLREQYGLMVVFLMLPLGNFFVTVVALVMGY